MGSLRAFGLEFETCQSPVHVAVPVVVLERNADVGHTAGHMPGEMEPVFSSRDPGMRPRSVLTQEVDSGGQCSAVWEAWTSCRFHKDGREVHP